MNSTQRGQAWRASAARPPKTLTERLDEARVFQQTTRALIRQGIHPDQAVHLSVRLERQRP